MSTVTEVKQKADDQMAAIAALTTSVDTFKAAGGKLNAADQVILDEIGTTMDANAKAIADLQIKINNS